MLKIDQETIDRNRAVWAENDYYEMAESAMEEQWHRLIWPTIKDCDFTAVVDLAAGHGRNSKKLIAISKELTVIDPCFDNIAWCLKRLKGKGVVRGVVCNGASMPVEDGSVTLVYCFDAMVHFEPEVVYNYLLETKRVLSSGGRAFLHHSNYTGICNPDWRYNPHARNFMSQNLFVYWASRIGLKSITSEVIDWEQEKELDCITLLEKQ